MRFLAALRSPGAGGFPVLVTTFFMLLPLNAFPLLTSLAFGAFALLVAWADDDVENEFEVPAVRRHRIESDCVANLWVPDEAIAQRRYRIWKC